MKQKIWRKRERGVLAAAIAGGLAVWLSGCGSISTRQQALVDTAMGTIVSQTLYVQQEAGEKTEKEEQSETAFIMRILTELEQQELSWRIADSEVGRINARAMGNARGDPDYDWMQEESGREQNSGGIPQEVLITMSIPPPQYELLSRIWQVSEDSGGAMDVTLGRLCRLWNLDELAVLTENGSIGTTMADGEQGQGEVAGDGAEKLNLPTAEQILAALADCGYGKVQLADGTITLPAGMQLDLGAVGKGIACDRISAYLHGQPQITGAVVAVGGSVVTYGQKPDGSPWKVAIMHPREEGSYLGVLSLEGEHYISTSGDYERYVMADGVRYHHILDPATGYPAHSGLCSVTIVCDSGLLADALSTACFVLGPEQGLALAQVYGAEALLVEEDGSLHMTKGMEEMYDTYGNPP